MTFAQICVRARWTVSWPYRNHMAGCQSVFRAPGSPHHTLHTHSHEGLSDYHATAAAVESKGQLQTPLSWRDTLKAMPTNAPNWKRPQSSPITDNPKSLEFQLLDVQEHNDDIVLFGVTQEGRTICVRVESFQPLRSLQYIVPDGLTTEALILFARELQERYTGLDVVIGAVTRERREATVLTFSTRCESLLLTLKEAELCGVESQLRGGSVIEGITLGKVKRRGNYEDHSRVADFMSEKKIAGLQWLEIPIGNYSVLLDDAKVSLCQLEVATRHHLLLLKHENESQVAPLRILSFDIENLPNPTASYPYWRRKTKTAPEVARGDVIQICNMVTTLDGLDRDPLNRVAFTLNTCYSITGSAVRSFKDRKSMIEAWIAFVHEVDPDIILGYNSVAADVHRLIQDANYLDIPFLLGRLKNVETKMDHPVKVIPGRIHFDLYNHYFRKYWRSLKARVGDGSMGLGNVSQHFLETAKEDFDGEDLYSVIAKMQATSPETRRELALYCLKDAYLTIRLLHELKAFDQCAAAWKQAYQPFHLFTSEKSPIIQEAVDAFAEARYSSITEAVTEIVEEDTAELLVTPI
ncbi:ribonuclease H-like protein [Hymenopellis radicata]|nr:ribonuclease H-like protein [Hymenopellis radicata]